MSILIPTTEHSLVYAKEGWSALAPSLQESVHWFLYQTTVAFKLGVFGVFVLGVLVWLLEREIKRRQIVERVQGRINAVNTSIKNRYERIRAEIERESRIAAQLLPHVLFVFAFTVFVIVFQDAVYLVARGFGSWAVVVGFPVFFSTKRMIEYDLLRRSRKKTSNPQDLGVSSDENDDSDVDDSASVGSSSGTMPGNRILRELNTNPHLERIQGAVELILHRARRRFMSSDSFTPPAIEDLFTAETIGDLDSIVDWLRYWSVLSCALFLEQFPLTGHFLGFVPIWPEVRLGFALWLQLPFTRGCDLAFKFVVPVIDMYIKKIPALQEANKTVGATLQQRSMIAKTLSMFGFVSERTVQRFLRVTEKNGTMILISVPFLMSPNFVTKIGVLIVGLSFPAHSSVTAILEFDRFKEYCAGKLRRGSDGDEADEEVFSGESILFWLEYWVVYVLQSLAIAPLQPVFGWWFPLWDQIHLCSLLWLQLTYFSGAHHLFNLAVLAARVYRRRRRASARTARRRASSIMGPVEKIQNIVGGRPPQMLDAIAEQVQSESAEGEMSGGSMDDAGSVVVIEREESSQAPDFPQTPEPVVFETKPEPRRASSSASRRKSDSSQ